MSNQKKLREDITFLRAISVLIVVIFHFTFPLSKGGFIGVDVFFVISGFLMTQIIETGLQEDKFRYSQFLASRIKRIWPAMAVMLLSLLLFGAVFMPPIDTKVIAEQALYAVGFVSNHYYLSTSGYFTGDNDSRWLLHTWSLSVEWQFYMIYPFILMGSRKLATRLAADNSKATTWHIGQLGLLFIVSLGLCVYLSRTDASMAFFALPTRAWEMIAGGMAFFAYKRIALTASQSKRIGLTGIAVIAGSFLLVGQFDLERYWPSYFALLPVAGAFLVLWAAFGETWIIKNKLTQSIGLWSYSIYLWHWPLVALFGVTLFQDKFGMASKALGIGLSVVFGYLSYRFVEKSGFEGVKRPPAAMIAAGVLAALLLTTNGLIYKVSNNPFYASLTADSEAKEMPKECSNYKVTADALKTCKIERSGQARALVIGDSHARHLYPWFNEKAAISTDFLVSVGCPSIPGFNRSSAGYHCHEFAEKAWQRALSGDYKVVFVSMNWSAFIPANGGMCRVGNGKCVAEDLTGPMTTLDKLVGVAKEKGIKVVLIDATPFFKYSVPQYLYRHSFWGNNPQTSLTAAGFAKESPVFAKSLTDIQKKYAPTAGYESLATSLCVGDVCQVYDRELNRPVFSDKDHFNPDWIAARGDVLMKYFED